MKSTYWREPLLHFVLIGAALFLAFGLTQEPDASSQKRIVVDSSTLEQLAAQFERTWMRPPTASELDGLIESHVRDEVYYREAVAMGLDRNDPVVRQRMRLKLEFILEDLTAEVAPSDQVLAEFMREHDDRFRLEPRVSFQQLYLNPGNRRDLDGDAKRILARLKHGASPKSFGDPTLLQQQFSLATRSEIARAFGDSFAEQVVQLVPGDWAGPLYSGLGGHLIKVTDRVAARLPKLNEVRALVEREYLAQRRQQLKDLAYQRLREGYQVVIEPAATSDGTMDSALAASDPEAAGK